MIAVLHNIRSIHNVGSIFRTADGAGAEMIYLCGITPTPYDQFGKLRKDFSKTALGAHESVGWEYRKSIYGLLDSLHEKNYILVGIEQDKRSIPYNSLRLKREERDRTVLVVGHERHGLSSAILRRMDHILEIPMLGEKESLNVSVAFGIVMYSLAL